MQEMTMEERSAYRKMTAGEAETRARTLIASAYIQPDEWQKVVNHLICLRSVIGWRKWNEETAAIARRIKGEM